MANVKYIYSLSPMQEGMMYHSMLSEDDTSYHCQNLVWMNSKIDLAYVKETMNLLLDKFEVLRTSFIIPKSSGKPWQVVLDTRDVEVKQIVAIGKDEDTVVEQVKKDDLEKGFDLKDDCLIRVTIVTFGEERHLFMFSFHHIIMDGWCISLVLKDYLRIYKSLINGASISSLKDEILREKIQTAEYKEYIEWLGKQDKEKGLSYWVNVLEDYNGNSEIIPMSTLETTDKQIEVISKTIPRELYARIEQLAIKNSVTINTIAEAAWGVLLSKYTHSNDVVFGKVVSGRNAPISGIEQIVGLFVNTIPIRAKFSDDESIADYIKSIGKQGLETNQYSYISLADIQEQLNGMSSLIQSLFVFENYYVDTAAYEEGINDFNLELASAREKTNYNLTIAFFNEGDGLNVTLSYNPNVYEENEVSKILERLVIVFEAFTKDISVKVSDIEIIDSKEKDIILNNFNDTIVEYSKDKTVVDLFEEQVKKTPNRVAVIYENSQLTYAELNAKANQLGRKLRKLGVKPDDFVVIMAERSLEMVIGIYGILKAGGAYVPIDQTYPEDRKQFMINDCSPKCVLVYGTEIESDVPVIDLANSEVWEGAQENPERVNKPSDLIYCIYTSGTTGQPKGVMIEHKGVVNFIGCNEKNKFQSDFISRSESVYSTNNIIFDITLQDIILPLCNGVKIILSREYFGSDDLDLYNNIGFITTPTKMGMYLNSNAHLTSKVNTYMIGAEKLEKWLVNKIQNVAPQAVIYNGYGPTETTCGVLYYNCSDSNKIGENIPIGKPISNTQIYILDGIKLCGIGIPGELCIAGDGLARGYLNKPELTAEKFIDNPYGKGKLYRTGDLARWIHDGNIEYLGRIDDQVKVRGFRIELGEIESAIRRVGMVEDTAVIVIKDDNGENSIVAYIVSKEEEIINVVKNEISKCLPSYMVPSYFIRIPEIPVTANGKLDRRFLSQFEIKRRNEYIAPETEMQAVICKIFQEVLKVTEVGIEDNFFELGGHSLKAVAMVNRIEAELSKKMPIGELFYNNTPKAIETYLIKEENTKNEIIPRAERKEYYVASSIQKRIYMVNSLSENSTFYNMPISIRIYGEVSIEKVEEIIATIIKRHDILRTEFVMKNDEILQYVCDSISPEFTYVEDFKTSEKDLLRQFVRSFSLDKAPLIRVGIVKRENCHILMLDMHHIIGDGTSMELIIGEFMTLYNGGTLPEVAYQYYDYCEWNEDFDYEAQQKFWKGVFEDEVPVLHLPYDFERPIVQSFKGKTIVRNLSKELSNAIYQINKKLDVTEYMFFLSTAMILLSKYSRQDDMVIGSPVSGRCNIEFENVVGMFVNTLALRGKPEREKSFELFVNEIKEICLKAYENQEYPFEKLVEDVNCVRDMSRNPIFDVMVAYQNTETAKINFSNGSIERIEFENDIAKFDLTFNIFPEEEGFRVELEFCTDLFREDTILAMLDNYESILRQIVKNQYITIADIEAISENGYKRIMQEFNDTLGDYHNDSTVIEQFERIVNECAEKQALVLDDAFITYEELNNRANALGRFLRANGVEKDDFVALLTTRSFEMIIAMLGVMKAGGAYVPIDPNYPQDRIKYMIEDCGAKVILQYGCDVILDTDIPVINLDDLSIWDECKDNLSIIADKDSAVYCIYTSGTTGRPKGVVIENKGLICYAENNIRHCNITSDDYVLQFANYVFDASAFEMYIALLSGATLVLISNDTISNIKAFNEYVRKNKVSISILPPSYYLQSDVKGLKVLFTGGSASNKAILERAPKENAAYINAYGPTENTIVISMWDYEEKYTKCSRIPIGKPVMNSKVYIMDGNNMCGIGVPGELCVVGDGVARGYLNLPEVTAEKFTESPFGDGKMYRTGDLARWLPDGNIEFMDRIDDQIKVRGFRIELAEIEENIRKIEDIVDATVICKKDSNDENAIYAYVVSNVELELNVVRKELGMVLPAYMIPSYMMQIDEIPLNQSGKVNKKLLPDINTMIETEYIEPETELEKTICHVFAEVLAVDRMGLNDNFFEHGGHSLSAMVAINHIEEKTGIRVSLIDIFKNDTPKKLCTFMENSDKTGIKSLPKAKEKLYYKMSPAQRRIFITSQIDEVGTSYNMPQCLRIGMELDVEKVKQTLQKLTDRHEILRTSFVVNENEFVQIIANEAEVDFTYIEDHGTTDELMECFVKEFDFTKAPLMRMQLVKTETEYLLFLDMHHIIGDGMSLEIFIYEFFMLYFEQQLQPLTHQYKDYSEWLATTEFYSQRDYWLNIYSDDIPILDLPYDYVRPVQQSYDGDIVYKRIGVELTNKIGNYASDSCVTNFMVLLSALMVLLGKYANQQDIVVGTVANGRTHQDTEKMLGMFINTLALRGKPEKNKSITEFIGEIKETCISAFENQQYPFDELVSEAKIELDRSRNPLFDVMLILQNNESNDDMIFDEKIEYLQASKVMSKYDFTLYVNQKDGEYELALEYCTKLFKRESMERLQEHFISILEQIVEDDSVSIREIEAITGKEKEKILTQFNETKECIPNKNIIELFKEQVKTHKDRVAFKFENQVITYQELDEKSNIVANKLKMIGIKNEDRVIIIAQRSLELVIGIYGILKAGAAYVPVAPDYPKERIQYMITDSEAKAILVYNANIDTTLPVIDMGDDKTFIGDDEAADVVIEPENLAYVIYTSGTTGQPKGVMLEHKNVVNYCHNNAHNIMKQALDLGYKKFASLTNSTFDIFVTEIFLSILNGMTVTLANNEEQERAMAFKKMVEKESIEIVQLTPSRAKMLMLDDNANDVFRQLKYIMLGGEKVERTLVDKLRLMTDATLQNVYGPTETTVWSTQDIIRDDEMSSVSIGTPIANTKVYVLDGISLCGIGVPGELCIAGKGLARGYLNRAQLTEEKFISNPFGDDRLYRTGDLVRWLSDGRIEFIGRIDHQVKVRGHRIELGEIESEIRRLPGVVNAVAIVRKDSDFENAIYAYYIAETVIEIDVVRKALIKTLPDYMVPAYIAQIEEIPLNKSGKLDQKALPDISKLNAKEYVSPQNDIQQKICSLFEEVVQLNKVGITDNFFEIGGHSLRAVMLVNRIESEFGIRLSLKEVFDFTTPEKLALLLETKKSGTHTSDKVIQKAVSKEFYPMSHVQKRFYMLNQMDKESLAYNMPMCVKLIGTIDKQALDAAVKQLVERHDILRTRFIVKDNEFVQHILKEVTVEFDQIEDNNSSVEELMQQFERTFDLAEAPLMRMRLIKQKENSLLLLDMHHIISDGTSMELMIGEFMQLYNGVKLPYPRVQYSDYSEWMNGRNIDDQKEYWLHQFEDDIPVLDLPYDFPRARKQLYNGSSTKIIIPKELKERMKLLEEELNITDNMLFLAATMITLSKYSKQEDIVIGTPVSGRVTVDMEDMLGAFVNTLAFRGKPVALKSIEQFLLEIKKVCLDGYDNQEYPYEELIDSLEVTRDVSRNPLFDVMLVLQNTEQNKNMFDDIVVEQVALESNVAKLDLSFYVTEMDEGYECVLEYCTDLFTEESAKRMQKHLLNTLLSITENRKQCIGDINLLTREEEQLIHDVFNHTKHVYDTGKTIIDILEEQTKETPKAIALEFGEIQVSYEQFNGKANALARRLQMFGVTKNDRVAILANRSIEMVEAIFGILKAGCTYVPIDIEYPAERKEFILKDSDSKLLLVYDAIIDFELAIPLLDLKEETAWNGGCNNLPEKPEVNDGIYCIYTSGTTGKPKGVVNTHKGISNLIYWMQAKYPLTNEDAILLKTTYVFDVSASELFWWPLAGSKLVILEPEAQKDAYKICDTIMKHSVSMIDFVPSMLAVFLMEEAFFDKLESLKYIIAAGEALSPAIVNKYYTLAKKYGLKGELLNLYGPTEASIYSTWYHCEPNCKKVLIGKPVGNTQIYIMENGRLCSPGIPGELCIAGNGLAKGYLNRDELNEEKFVPNPFCEGKMYRSGDLARWTNDGNIEYLGRMDDQVKIRGFRIELSEIDCRLRMIEGVRDSAVITKKENDNYVILAYLVSENPDICEKAKKELAQSVPEYMIPSYMMVIEEIPLTTNGKLNRRKLPEIVIEDKKEYVAPATESEELVCTYVGKIVGRECVSVMDNFFALGGDSIKAMQLVIMIGQANLHLSLSDVFDSENIREICHRLTNKPNDVVGAGPVGTRITTLQQLVDYLSSVWQENESSVLNAHIADTYELSPMQQMTATKDLMMGGIIVDFDHYVNADLLKDTLLHIINSQGVMRSTLAKSNKEIELVEHEILKDFTLAFVDLSSAEHSLVQGVRSYISNELFNERMERLDALVNQILWKAFLIKYREDSFKLYLIFNHLIFDGMSMEILKSIIIRTYFNNAIIVEEDIPRYGYGDYIRQIAKGATDIDGSQIIEMFKLKRFMKAIDIYDKISKDNLTNYQFSIKLKGNVEEYEHEKMWNVAYGLFKSIMADTFAIEIIPFAMMIAGREFSDKQFYTTIGEFIDLMPMSDDVSDGYDYKEVSKLIRFAGEHNINFMSILTNEKLRRKYLSVVMLLSKLRKTMETLPVFSYLGLLTSNMNKLEEIDIIAEEQSLSTTVNVYCYKDTLYVELFGRKNEKDHLFQMIKEYLKKEGIVDDE